MKKLLFLSAVITALFLCRVSAYADNAVPAEIRGGAPQEETAGSDAPQEDTSNSEAPQEEPAAPAAENTFTEGEAATAAPTPTPQPDAAVSAYAYGDSLDDFRNGSFIWGTSPIKGAAYTVISKSIGATETIETDETGFAVISGLPYAEDYVIKEKSVPGEIYGTAVLESAKAITSGIPIYFEHKVPRFTVCASMADSVDAEISLYAACEIISTGGSVIAKPGTLLVSKQTGSDGKVTFDNLPGAAFAKAGYMYVVRVTSLPDGYAVSSSPDVLIDGTGEEAKAEFAAETYSASIRYVDLEGNPVAGAQLAVADEGGKVIHRFRTDEKSHEITEKGLLSEGAYTVTVESPAAGCETYHQASFTLTKDAKHASAVIVADMNRTTATLIDGTDGQPIRDALIEIKNEYGETVRSIRTDGKAIDLSGMADGTYQMSERTAPMGYVTADPIQFEVSVGEIKDPPIMVNDRVTTQIRLLLTDEKDGAPVPGAVYVIYDKDEAEIGVLRTDMGGTAVSDRIGIAAYADGAMSESYVVSVRQKTAPEGYLISEEDHQIILSYQNDTTPVVVNQLTVSAKRSGSVSDELMQATHKAITAWNAAEAGKNEDSGASEADTPKETVTPFPTRKPTDGGIFVEQPKAETPNAGSNTAVYIIIAVFAAMVAAAAAFIIIRRRRE